MAVEFTRFPTAKQAADALHNELRRVVGDGEGYYQDGPQERDRPATAPLVVMLAGGTTPMAVYRRLAEEPPPQVHPALHFLLSDDRYVPPEDERSNYGHIRPMATSLGLPEERVIHIDASRPLPEAVGDFGTRIADAAARDAVFALAILGIGSDGHTASLFSPALVPYPSPPRPVRIGAGTLLSTEAADLAVHTGVHGGVDRVSVSADVLLSFRRLVFFATGKGKHDILYDLSRRPEDYPAGRVLLQHPNATIWTDEAPRVR